METQTENNLKDYRNDLAKRRCCLFCFKNQFVMKQKSI